MAPRSSVHIFTDIYIYIIYTPNLGLEIAIPGREREQGRFRGSSEGVRGSSEGARGSSEGARGSSEGARESIEGVWGSTIRQYRGVDRWEPEMGFLAFGLSCFRYFQYL